MKRDRGGLIVEPIYVVSKMGGSFRPGLPAKVIDIVWGTPEGADGRLCLHVMYEDGVEDYCVFDLLDFDIISETEYEQRVWPKPA